MKKILIVEDNVSIAHLLRTALNYQGYEVFVAYSGKEMLEVVEQSQIDLVLLDLYLPDINGLQLCKEIRIHFPILPIIVMSTSSNEHDKVLALQLGADDYITKPFFLDEIQERIRVQFLH